MRRIHGKTLGLKPDQRRRLALLYRRRVPVQAWVTRALADELVALARDLGRMVGVVVGRRGHVHEVAVGDAQHVDMPAPDGRPGAARFSGVRTIVTAPDDRTIGERDLEQLRRARLDAVVQVAVPAAGHAPRATRAYLLPPNPDDHPWAILGPEPVDRVPEDFLAHVRAIEDEIRERSPSGHDVRRGGRVLLVATPRDGEERHLAGDIAELGRLVASSGRIVVGEVVQRRALRDPKTLVRAGKVAEIATRALQTGADTVVFLEELTPSQANNLLDAVGLPIVDRTQLILEIFAQRATTREGKIKVELARLRYMLPRLVGQGHALSRLGGGRDGGGIGSNRGVGEKQLERDRRRAQEAIDRLEGRLEKLRRGRELRRTRRRRAQVPVLALVGYTNAGKSTWINRLTGAELRAEDRLFSTLETTARRTRLPSGRDVVVTDTVGFIRDLPADLKATFHATLEELADATVLVLVADASDDDAFEKVDAVEALLAELALGAVPSVVVFNKADRVDRDGFRPFLADMPGAMLLSAREPMDVFALRRRLDDALDAIPGTPPRRIAREDEVVPKPVEPDTAAPRERHDYVDELDAAPSVPRPRDDRRARHWGFFDEE